MNVHLITIIEAVEQSKNGDVNEVHKSFKNGAKLMGLYSILSNLIGFIYFIGFTICYSTSFTLYLPLCISISTLFNSLNFGQSRKFYYDYLIPKNIHCSSCNDKSKNTIESPSPPQSPHTPTPNSMPFNTEDTKKVSPLHVTFKIDPDLGNNNTNTTHKRTQSKSRKSMTSKALQLIGVDIIKPGTSQSDNELTNDKPMKRTMFSSKSHSIYRKKRELLSVKLKKPTLTPASSHNKTTLNKLSQETQSVNLLDYPSITNTNLSGISLSDNNTRLRFDTGTTVSAPNNDYNISGSACSTIAFKTLSNNEVLINKKSKDIDIKFADINDIKNQDTDGLVTLDVYDSSSSNDINDTTATVVTGYNICITPQINTDTRQQTSYVPFNII